ncbi:hypothetical protein M3Y98_01208700 [Aphelenchoides besseyi]|nr:hypothetical protein M3Y98_01208700 [Aphelenchoides besseyi]KAI6193229.1 hypothetical protein M3Y96_00996400 [Aphelenchoides besseyi]
MFHLTSIFLVFFSTTFAKAIVNDVTVVDPTCFADPFNTELVVIRFVDTPACRSYSAVDVQFQDVIFLNIAAQGNGIATLNITLGDQCRFPVVAEPVANKTMSLKIGQFKLNKHGLLVVGKNGVSNYTIHPIRTRVPLACTGTSIWRPGFNETATLKIGLQVPLVGIDTISFVISSIHSITRVGEPLLSTTNTMENSTVTTENPAMAEALSDKSRASFLISYVLLLYVFASPL